MQISQVNQGAATLLGDPARNLWTDAVLTEYAKDAHNEIQNDLILNGMRPFETVSNPVTITAGSTSLSSISDLFLPISMKERAVGTTDWIPMVEKEFEPAIPPTSTLGYWAFRGNAIKFIGATQDREVLVQYYTLTMGTIVDVNSNINLNNAIALYSAKVAYLAAAFKGRNEKAATRLENLYDRRLATYIGIEVLNKQGVSHRRLPYQTKRRMGVIT